jgi:hypothetical protein
VTTGQRSRRCQVCQREIVWLDHADQWRHRVANQSGDHHSALPAGSIAMPIDANEAADWMVEPFAMNGDKVFGIEGPLTAQQVVELMAGRLELPELGGIVIYREPKNKL